MNSIISLANISLHRGQTSILEEINWEIKENQHWALMGPNGCGKTTLLKIISGNLWPSMGTVAVLEKEFGKTDLRELKKHIGWVSSYLIERVPKSDTILNIIISGKFSSFGLYQKTSEQDEEKARSLLELLNASYLENREFPVISQGERQRVLIARALMADPKLLIMDEPCTGLDPKARQELLESISNLCKNHNTTIIYVTHHQEEIIPEITNMLLLKAGKIFKQGTPQELITKPTMEELFDFKSK